MSKLLAALTILICVSVHASILNLGPLNLNLVQKDIAENLAEAGLKNVPFKITWQQDSTNSISFACGKELIFKLRSTEKEQISTAYYGLRKLGFLFPHPRMKVVPKIEDIKKQCGHTWLWKPIIPWRGFHLHTEHPSEWVDGFFMDQPKIAEDTVWWLARNQQNLLQLQTIRIDDEKLKSNLLPVVKLCRELGIKFGMSFGLAMFQQKNYYLVPVWRALTGIGFEDELRKQIARVLNTFDLDYVTSELGTTEFTSTDPERTLKMLEIYQEELAKKDKDFFVKSHVSSNQFSEKYGNFNFLPRFSSPRVGVQAHTVFFYGLSDQNAPMYGRKDYKDMTKYMLAEKGKRNLWYFPETSYYIGMDIDIPLFLTDFLVMRAKDMTFLAENKIDGQVNFSTGQELGYWLFDWNLALLVDADLQQDPLAGLKLLGENPEVWQKILNWQTKHIKNNQLIQALSVANFMDEIPFAPRIHERFLLRELSSDKNELQNEIEKLKNALNEKPDIKGIKNEELRTLMEVLYLRTEHALKLREALAGDRDANLEKARAVRELALNKMKLVRTKYSRYPESFVFDIKENNPTGYGQGYGWTAANLHYWAREENMIRFHQTWNPFYQTITNPIRILF